MGHQKKFIYDGSQYKAVTIGVDVPSVPHIANVSLTASWASWSIPVNTVNLAIQARSTGAISLSLDDSHSPYMTIKAGDVLSIDEMYSPGGPGLPSGTVLYMMCSAGDTAEIMYWTEGVGLDCQS